MNNNNDTWTGDSRIMMKDTCLLNYVHYIHKIRTQSDDDESVLTPYIKDEHLQ
jgi:hypothetical protein